jgi:hypothetical protein
MKSRDIKRNKIVNSIIFQEKVVEDIINMSSYSICKQEGRQGYGVSHPSYTFNNESLLSKILYKGRVKEYLEEVYGVSNDKEKNNILWEVHLKTGWEIYDY